MNSKERKAQRLEKFKKDAFVSFSFKNREAAEKIVKYLQDQYNLSMWICTHNILGGKNFQISITDAIKSSGSFIFIQSKESLASRQIPREVEIADKNGKIIIPFRIDDGDIEDSPFEYALVLCESIDGTTPTFETRMEELYHSIVDALAGKNRLKAFQVNSKLISSSELNAPVNKFVGRKDVLNKIDEIFSNGYRTIFLSGIGGIGKTQIAKKYLFDNRDQFNTSVYINYTSNLINLINDNEIIKIKPTLNRKNKEDGSIESDEEFFKRKLAKLKEITNENTLIILDNFDVEHKPEFDEFLNGPYRLIVTTRCDYSSYNYQQINIQPIEDENELKELFFYNYKGDLVEKDDKNLLNLFKLVNNHTYAIELIAKHMTNDCQTVEDAIKALQSSGVVGMKEEVVDREFKQNTVYNSLCKIFNLSNLSEEEKQALRFMSFVTNEGIHSAFIKKWAGSEVIKTIRLLEEKSWVIRSTKGYSLHPIVKEIVQNSLEISYKTCKPFIDGYNEFLRHEASWSFRMNEKEIYASFGRQIIKYIPLTEETEELYYDIECLFSYGTSGKEAVALEKQIYEYYLNKNGDADFYTGRAAFRTGFAYLFNVELPDYLENAKEWLLLGEKILRKVKDKINDEQKVDYYHALRHVAKVYQLIYEKTHDEEFYQKALHQALENLDNLSKEKYPMLRNNRFAGANVQIADIYLAHKEYEKALEHNKVAEKILIPLIGETDTDSYAIFSRNARCYFGLGRYEEALEVGLLCANGFVDTIGKYHSSTLGMYELCLECYKKENNLEKIDEFSSIVAEIKKVLY